MSKSIGQDIYGQILSSWRFMHIGLYFDKVMSTGIQFPKIPDFMFNGLAIEIDAVNAFWPKEFIGRNSESYFGSHTFFFACREILSGAVEGLTKKHTDNYLTFKTHTKELLKDQYEDFDIMIRFCRNVLSHNVTENIELLESDFKSQKNFLINNKKSLKKKLDITYSELFGDNYGFQGRFVLEIDFNKVIKGESFFNIVSQKQLMGLLNLTASIAETYIGKRANIYIESFQNKKA